MKKTVIVIIALMLIGLAGVVSAAPKDKTGQKYLSHQETLKILQNMGITQGDPTSYVKSAETQSKDWQVHLFTIQRGDAFMPLLTYVNKKDIVVGILIRDGKIVMPKIPIDEMQPSVNMNKVKLSTDNRATYNSSGKEIIYMFTDPDCPYCQPIEQRLPQYKGKYKIIVKHFPLEQIHPGAREKAIEKQCLWLSKGNCDDKTRQLAKTIVEEDIQEGTTLGVDATPFFINQKGKILREIPDLGKN